MTELSDKERRGLNLFEGDKAKCSACHISTPGIAPDGSVQPPLFTDFTYDNLGLPRNVNIPGNPAPNPGLGGRDDIAARDPAGAEIGKQKVMGLRNIAITPPYGHNGVFKTLEQITHFYNTRDTLGWVVDNNDPGFGVKGWPSPEVPQNVNKDELGDLGLTPEEESDLVAFMRTLTDNYPAWGRDPKVPPGTPSPFAEMPFPPFP
jgi:cytochrome c peroxidase